MEPTSVHIGSLLIHAPVNAGTCLLLSVQALAYGALLRRDRGQRARGWSFFFLAMGLATTAGVFKHGVPDLIGARGMVGVLAFSNVASGVSTWFAQGATLPSRSSGRLRSVLGRLTGIQLGLYLMANALLGPGMEILIVNTVVGLVPVIVAEATAPSDAPGGYVAAGILLSLVTGLVYLGRIAPSPWFDHVDVAHLVMAVSFYLIHRGVHQGVIREGMAAPLVVPSGGRAILTPRG